MFVNMLKCDYYPWNKIIFFLFSLVFGFITEGNED